MKQNRTARSKFFIGCLCIGALGLSARAIQIQIVQHDQWAERAESQILRMHEIPAPRGAILDRNGIPLALSQERYTVGVAPRELENRDSVQALLKRVLGAPDKRVRLLTDTTRKWVVIPGLFNIEQRTAFKGIRGVYFEEQIRRTYPQGEVARPILGRVSADGRVLGGIEAALDSILKGKPGQRTVYRDAYGKTRRIKQENRVDAIPGADVVLTIDAGLQEIADNALRRAMQETEAEGGDVVLMNSKTGDILAAVSYRGPRSSTLGMITTPYEPGSIIKPLVFAALVNEGVARLDEKFNAENGVAVINGRRVTDSHKADWLTLSEALVESSNIVTIKAATRLSPQKQYDYFRNLGFGRATEVGLPGEASGRLRPVKQWSMVSQGSLAIGYELAATPLQIAAAYTALSNNGQLVQPRIVREIRHPAAQPEPIPVRTAGQVFNSNTAAEIREVLRLVVTEGTGRNADLGNFSVAGKTGTSRAWGKGGYSGHHASFAGFFPADSPQVTFLVRVMRPKKGGYYGGAIAAPIARDVLQAMVSLEDPPISRELLAHGIADPISVPPTKPKQKEAKWSELRTGDRLKRGSEGWSASEKGPTSIPLPSSAQRPSSESSDSARAVAPNDSTGNLQR